LLGKIVTSFFSALLLISIVTPAFNIQPAKAEPTTITVPDDYPTIQEAINMASPGDTILVRAGIYYENIVVNKTVSLIGESREKTIIDGNGTGTVITVEASNLTIEGFTIRNSGVYEEYGVYVASQTNVTIQNNSITNSWCGILLCVSSNNSVSGNNIANNEEGICLDRSSKTIISGNNITANNWVGIRLFYSSNNGISGNSIKNNEYGIYLHICNNNHLSENIMDDNKYNLCVLHSSDLSGYLNSIDASNLANGKPIFYLVNQTNLVINHATHPQVGYLGLVNCANITVDGLTIADNGQGILLAFTNNSRIMNNTLTNNRDGISMYSSSNNTVSGNIMTRNYDDGFVLGCSSNNTFYGNSITYNGGEGGNLWLSYGNIFDMNNIENNTYGFYLSRSSNNIISGNNIYANNHSGIHLYDSSNNILYHNNFIDNTQHVHIPTPGHANAWDDGYPSGGNYWSDYSGTDADGDGVGDTPYTIDANNTDRYPLIAPITVFDAGTWNGTAYSVDVVSNSTVSDFYFNPEEGPFLRFNVTGMDGTAGFCRVTIPKDLLWVEDGWTVSVGGEPVDYTIIPDQNFTYLYFTYNHSTKIVVIQGTDVIPEFPSTILLLPFLTLLTILSALTKKKHHLRKAKNRP